MSRRRSPTRRLLVFVLVLLPALLVVVAGSVPASAADSDPVGGWPLQPQPEVVALFDPPSNPYGSGHRGVDLLGSVGQVVSSALPGTVSFAGSIAGRGVVVVDHGATRTTYEPVASTVAVGTAVSTGTPIGTLQPGGSHCAPHFCLHWGWIEGETYLDPLRLVGAGPVRLLPLWTPLSVSGPRVLGPALGAPAPRTAAVAPTYARVLRMLHDW